MIDTSYEDRPDHVRADRDTNADLDGGTVVRALHAANNLVVITDPRQDDNPIVWVNDYFCDFTGYSRAEVIGRNCRFLQGDDRDQPERDELREAVVEERKTHVLLRNYRKDGSLFYNDLYVSPVRGDGGEVTYFIGVQNDATARVEAQRRASEHEREVHETAENERERFGMDLHDGLGQTLAGSTMLAHALSHDLRRFGGPGGVLDTYPEALRDRVRKLAEHAATLQAHIERTVVEARGMAQGLNPIDASPQGLGDALRQLGASVGVAGGEGGPEIKVVADEVAFPDRRQARHLYRIAQEALSNAVRHAEATRIGITLHRVPQGVLLEVSDDGRGVDGREALSVDPEASGSHRRGRGLPSIRYRSDLIGARTSIGPRQGGGTVVRTLVPNAAIDVPQHRRLSES